MSDQHSKLLINEEPLQLLPSLAMAVGFNEAVVLQQLQFWMRNPKIGTVRADGRKWVFNTYEQWREDNFPFWHVDTVKRAFLSLEKQGVVLSDTPGGRDRKKWYTIDYDALNDLTKPKASITPALPPPPSESPSAESATMHKGDFRLSDEAKSADASGQNPPMERGALPPPAGQSAPVINKVSENTSETTHRPLSLVHPRADSPQTQSAPAGGGEPCSRFSRKERLAYYQNKPGVKDPEALSMAAFVRRGEADEQIAEWYASNKPVGKEPPRDTSACPDCAGRGLYEPGGKGKGFAKCPHARLPPKPQTAARASP